MALPLRHLRSACHGLAFVLLGGCQQSHSLSVSKSADQDGYSVSLTSEVDALTVYEVRINKGECNILGSSPDGIALKAGQMVKVRVLCNPDEVDIKSNLGAETFMLAN